MKKLLTLTGIAGIGAVLALLAACQTTGTSDVVAQKEALLAQSGFKVITVTTPKQQQAVSGLSPGQVFGGEVQREDVLRVSHWRRRIRSTSGNKPNSTGISMHLRRRMPAIQPAIRLRRQPGQQLIAGQSLSPH